MSHFTGFLVVLVLCLFEIQESTSACITVKEPCLYQSCACPSTLAGVVNCAGCSCDTCRTCTQSANTCVSCNACQEVPCDPYMATTTAIGCSTCDSCFRDTACPCRTCPDKPSPVCSCLKTLKDTCSCGSCKRIYFPEVEYPTMILSMNPTFFSNCWNF
ncbi:hypothetical protein O0L34_g12721 [Tuta absoluta]|nr:hypothetical protein O0L34_g12721 [Tuta absoluta]